MKGKSWIPRISTCFTSVFLLALAACSPAIPYVPERVVRETVVVKETVVVGNPGGAPVEAPVSPTLPPAPVEAPPESPLPEGPATKLVLISLDSIPSTTGWDLYEAMFAVENPSSGWQSLVVDTGPGVVETQEGFTYDVDPVRYTEMVPLLFGDPLMIPAGFRIIGSTDDHGSFTNRIRLRFEVAQGAHPTRVKFQNYGTVELAGLSSPSYPTDLPASSFMDMGSTAEVPGKARITFVQSQRTTYGVYQGVNVDLRFQNLIKGYDTKVEEGCFLVDGWGNLRWNKENVSFFAGPGQTTQTRLGFYLWEPERAYSGSFDISDEGIQKLLNNAKIVCRGEFDAVVNLSVSGAATAGEVALPLPEPTVTTAVQELPPRPSTTEMRVYANQGWQNSGVFVNAGQQVTVEYLSDLWFTGAGDGGGHDASGEPNAWICGSPDCHEPIPDYPKYALVGRLGEGSDWLRVGNYIDVISTTTGFLYLRPNYGDQDMPANNPQGSIVVRITVR